MINIFRGERPPIVKPIDQCGRGLYETGRPPSATGADGPGFNTPALPTVAFENEARIASQPAWLMFLHATFNANWAQAGYVLIFDLTASDPSQLALIQPGAISRYTLGPVPASSGGTIIYESSAEVVPLVQAIPKVMHHGRQEHMPGDIYPWSYGLPFNFGIYAVASSTPRVYTPPQGNFGVASFVARVQA